MGYQAGIERASGFSSVFSVVAAGVAGDPILYQINRTSQGWCVELVNNDGIVKKPDQPAAVDPNGVAKVELRPRVPVQSARQWLKGNDVGLSLATTISVAVAPGETVFVELAAN